MTQEIPRRFRINPEQEQIWNVTIPLKEGLRRDATTIAEWYGQDFGPFVKSSVHLRARLGERQRAAEEDGRPKTVLIEGQNLHLPTFLQRYERDTTTSETCYFPGEFGQEVAILAEEANKTPEEYVALAVAIGVRVGELAKANKPTTRTAIRYEVGGKPYSIMPADYR